MSATIISDPMATSSAETTTQPTKLMAQIEVEFAKCECCGLIEECTPAYINRVRERFNRKWICGLCGEAVIDEIKRRSSEKLISTEEAKAEHMSFCQKFITAGPPPNPTMHLISAMRQIVRRSLDSPRSAPSNPSRAGPEIRKPGIARSGSCFSTLSGS